MDTSDEIDFSPGDNDSERVKKLKEKIKQLREKNEGIKDDLLDASSERNKYKRKVESLKAENERLKSSPLFVATVKEITSDGVVIRQHGNNQEALTDIPEDTDMDLDSGDRIAVNNSFAIVNKLSKETDSRAMAMQVEEDPQLTYDDIGGLEGVIQEVRETVEMPLMEPEMFDKVGIEPPSGVLLHGPPGTGKTMLAKAVANKTEATFIKMAGSELVHKFIGEGARLVRDLFEVARRKSPSIVFIDELDAVASKRAESKTSGDAEVQRTMMQLLSEMDGFESRGDIRIIGATNRFDMLDRAILRPGRFDRLIEVPYPSDTAREEIFEIHTRDMNLSDNIDFQKLSDITEGMSGAEIKAICTESGMLAVRDRRTEIQMEDFFKAAEKVSQEKEEEARMFA